MFFRKFVKLTLPIDLPEKMTSPGGDRERLGVGILVGMQRRSASVKVL